MVFYGYHGVFDEERKLGQRFVVSLTLTTEARQDSQIYKLEDTVDYTQVYQVVKTVMETEQFPLLETCANLIIEQVLAKFFLVIHAKVSIQKPAVAIQGSLQSAEIIMERARR
jgi:dihydroneopterin aldolase